MKQQEYKVIEVDGESVTYAVAAGGAQAEQLTVAFSVLEIGNHGDISITNPFTNEKLWVSASTFDATISLYVAMRRVITVAEKLHFLGDPTDSSNLPPAHVARLLVDEQSRFTCLRQARERRTVRC